MSFERLLHTERTETHPTLGLGIRDTRGVPVEMDILLAETHTVYLRNNPDASWSNELPQFPELSHLSPEEFIEASKKDGLVLGFTGSMVASENYIKQAQYINYIHKKLVKNGISLVIHDGANTGIPAIVNEIADSYYVWQMACISMESMSALPNAPIDYIEVYDETLEKKTPRASDADYLFVFGEGENTLEEIDAALAKKDKKVFVVDIHDRRKAASGFTKQLYEKFGAQLFYIEDYVDFTEKPDESNPYKFIFSGSARQLSSADIQEAVWEPNKALDATVKAYLRRSYEQHATTRWANTAKVERDVDAIEQVYEYDLASWEVKTKEYLDSVMQQAIKLLDANYVQSIIDKHREFFSNSLLGFPHKVFAVVSSSILKEYHAFLDECVEGLHNDDDLQNEFFSKIMDVVIDSFKEDKSVYNNGLAPFFTEIVGNAIKASAANSETVDLVDGLEAMFTDMHDSFNKPEKLREVSEFGTLFYTTDPLEYREKSVEIKKMASLSECVTDKPAYLVFDEHMIDPSISVIVNPDSQVYAILLPNDWQKIANREMDEELWRSFVGRITARPDLPLIDRQGKLVKMAEVFSYLTDPTVPITKAAYEAWDLVEERKNRFPNLSELFDSLGVKFEGLTVELHTKLVIGQFLKYFRRRVEQFPEQFALSFEEFIDFFFLHDIGKGLALAKTESTSTQHEETRPFMEPVLKACGYSEDRRNLMLTFMENDWIGRYFGDPLNEENSAENIIKEMKEKAEKLGYGGEKFKIFFDTAVVLYLSDASSYTSYAVAKNGYRAIKSLNLLFKQTKKEDDNRIVFSDESGRRLRSLGEKQKRAKDDPITYMKHYKELRRLALVA